MRIIFCFEPFSPLKVDYAYESELSAAQNAGFDFTLIDFEALNDEENAEKSIRKVKEQTEPVTAIYRGWMLKPKKYRQLFDALTERKINLINSPEQYKHCHYLPQSYSIIEKHTPKTISVRLNSEFSFDKVFQKLSVFGDKPLILKDFVKSRKHEWTEACFIPSASNRSEVERVVNRFLELQGEDLNEGLVFREFIEFQPLAAHSKSKMPLTKEFRLFFLDGKLLDGFEYWDEGDYSEILPPKNIFADVAKKVESRFFTMDVAQSKDDNWYIVELGDGQVAGLPDNANIFDFYRKLKENF